jgi:hypothetical protein
MGRRRAASAVLAGTCAIVLAVVLSAWTVSPTGAPVPIARADRASPGSVKIPGQVLSAPEAIAVAGARVWIANSFYPMTGSDSGWVTELSARTGADQGHLRQTG